MHYYNFNIAAYRAKTAHLNIIEHGIYRQLMDWYYLDEMPIPLETQVVMRRLCLGSDNLHNLENVLTDFFIKTDLGYCHSRITRELEHYQAQFAKNRVNGMLGGRPKKTTIEPKKTQVVSENNHMATQINPNQELITNNQELIYIPPIGGDLLKTFKKVRKAKRAGEYTEIAFKATEREALKAGISTERAIEICCERSWTNFNADWYSPKGNKNLSDRETGRQAALASIFKPEHTQHLMKTEKVVENAELKRLAD